MNNAQASNDSSVLDMQVIQGLRELGGEEDPGLVLELIELFLQDAPARMKEIEQSLTTGDTKALERAAHTLKSSSANIGAIGLSSICKQMESLAREKALDGITPLFQASTRTFSEVSSALRSIR